MVNDLEIDRANSTNQGTRVGLLTYANNTNPQFDLDDYTSKINILNAVGTIRYTGGTTNTAEAIKSVHFHFCSQACQVVLFLHMYNYSFFDPYHNY